ncbi:unnamed protein product [Symbiodinium necroappetens]|uniref:Uncharacterized protein n=1 Tax=Symbiodinium necroappetens TaxID=1628268 RepID=A0A813AGK4_9DINO|nr:unnamed protein product [Symbiodinium necroappetens]
MRAVQHKVDSIRRAARLANKLVRGFLARRGVRKLQQARLAQKKPSARQISQFIWQDIIPQGWKLFVEGQLIALRSFFQMF